MLFWCCFGGVGGDAARRVRDRISAIARDRAAVRIQSLVRGARTRSVDVLSHHKSVDVGDRHDMAARVIQSLYHGWHNAKLHAMTIRSSDESSARATSSARRIQSFVRGVLGRDVHVGVSSA